MGGWRRGGRGGGGGDGVVESKTDVYRLGSHQLKDPIF